MHAMKNSPAKMGFQPPAYEAEVDCGRRTTTAAKRKATRVMTQAAWPIQI